MSSLLTPQSTSRAASATNLFLFESERFSDGTTFLDVSAVSPTAPVEPDRLAYTIARFLPVEQEVACGRVDQPDVTDQSLEQPYGKIGQDHCPGEAKTQPAPADVSTVAGQVETIRVTGAHPFWSLDRQGWVRVEDLQAGERLQGIAGPVRVVSRTLRAEAEPVYNIEVDGDHCYRVGRQGLLVHNQSEPAFVQISQGGPGYVDYATPARDFRRQNFLATGDVAYVDGRRNLGAIRFIKHCGATAGQIQRIPAQASVFIIGTHGRQTGAEQHSEAIIYGLLRGDPEIDDMPGSITILELFTERSPCRSCRGLIRDWYNHASREHYTIYWISGVGRDQNGTEHLFNRYNAIGLQLP